MPPTTRTSMFGFSLLLITTASAVGLGQSRPEAAQVEPKRQGQEPTAPEQAVIYLINRARHDPAAYGKLIGIDLSDIAPAPPLALNKELTAAARHRATDMAKRNYFDHVDPDGVGPNRHALESGYSLARMYSRAATANNIESINVGGEQPERIVAALIIDRSDPNGGHRKHLLGADAYAAQARDIGVGIGRGAMGGRPRAYAAIHTARTDDEVAYVTGVVYRDRNGNRSYDAGEGLKGVTVSAGDQSTTTMQSGGFTLAARPGSVQLTCEKGPFAGRAAAEVQIDRVNVHVEFLAGRSSGIVNFGKPK